MTCPLSFAGAPEGPSVLSEHAQRRVTRARHPLAARASTDGRTVWDQGGGSVEFRVLGPLHALDAAGNQVTFASAAQRRLVSFLLQRANTIVPGPVLEEHLRLSPGALRVAISRLRRWIDPDALVSAPRGYELRTDRVDAREFERLLATARSSDDS